jgi:formate hydrogenlyase transcriptional activator
VDDIPRDLFQAEWGKALNRAMLEFGSALSRPQGPVGEAVKTLLRSIGEALTIEHVALVEYVNDTKIVAHTWQWSADGSDNPVLLSLLERVEIARDTAIIHANVAKGAVDERLAGARAFLERTPLRSAVVVPVGPAESDPRVMAFGSIHESYDWTEPLIEHLQVLGGIVGGALQNRAVAERSQSDPANIRRPAYMAKAQLGAGEQTSLSHGLEGIVGNSPPLRAALGRLEEVAKTESTVLLLGETGTGKELFARALHGRSARRAYPLISVNCGALPPTLIESELFGHQRGAFTGAVELRQGRFEMAHRGTLFLDEIGDLPAEVQVKLLRVLQEGEFERVGSSRSHSVDVRIIAATHNDLERAVAEGEFRADLYYRLNVFPISLPPLRARREDIPALVWAIIHRRQRAIHRQIKTVPADLMEMLKQHSWPGNIRELENIVERALIHSPGDSLRLPDWNPETRTVDAHEGSTLRSVERAHIQEVLRECGWKINGFGNAADRLGLHPNTLRFRMKKLGIIRNPTMRHGGSESKAEGRAS